MKILITGAAGFIGYHQIIKLLKKHPNIEIVGFDNLNNYYDVNLKFGRLNDLGIASDSLVEGAELNSVKYSNFKFVKGDLCDYDLLNKLFGKFNFTHVCNLGAQAGVRYSIENPLAYGHSNLNGFLNILNLSQVNNVEHFVYASSSSVYGLNEKMPFSVEDWVDKPVSLYAATKKANELMAHSYSHIYNMRTTGLRFFTVYGPWGRPDMAYFMFTNSILEGKPINVFNNGKLERDFTYVDDIVEGVDKVIFDTPLSNKSGDKPNNYQVHNIGNNAPVNLLEFIQTIENELGIEAKKIYQPMQKGDVYSTYADVTSLVNMYGYKPSTTLKSGVKKFVGWYKNYYKIN